MFGWKSKKDKIIEHQDERIKDLEGKLHEMYFKHPYIIQQNGQIISVGAKSFLEEGMPIEEAKRRISEKIVGKLEKFIHYDIDTDIDEKDEKANKLKPVITGYLNVSPFR